MTEYIEREALMDLLADTDRCGYLDGGDINSIPAADVAPVVHSHWIDGADSFGAKRGEYRVCENCNICFPRDDRAVPPEYWQLCPNCGCKMDGGNHEQET